MKICMLTWEFPPRIVGGIARHCLGLSKALAKRNHEVHVVTLEFPGTPLFEDVEGVKLHRVKIELGHPNFIIWTFIFNHFMEKNVALINRDVEFNVIHIHDWLTAPVGIASKHYLNKPLVSTVHSTEIGRAQGLHSPDSYLIDGVEWWMTYEAEKVISCSGSMKWELEHHFNLPPEKVIVIPNAVDTSKYERKINREDVKRRYGIEPYERVVLFIGRLVPQKGVEYLVKAIPLILQQHRNVKFVIAGDGWSKNYLEGLARTTGSGGKIRFLGFVSDSDLTEITMSADVLVVPSIYEPFGIAQIEPLTFGGICVFSSVCGCSGFVKDITGDEDIRNVIVADYTNLDAHADSDIQDLLQIDRTVRDHIEAGQSERVAMQICSRLPKNEAEMETMTRTGYELARNMSWDVVVRDYLLGSLEKIPCQVTVS